MRPDASKAKTEHRKWLLCDGAGIKGLVEAHGGRIWAEKNANGKRATFTFSLPLRLEASI
jgi:signal transduction histidine kinase